MIFLQNHDTLDDNEVPRLQYQCNEGKLPSVNLPKDVNSYIGQCAIENNPITVNVAEEEELKLSKNVEDIQVS